MSVGESGGAVVHEGVGGEDELDVPVGVGAGEEFDFETTVFGGVFVFDEDGACVAHVAGGGTLVNISHSLRIKSIGRKRGGGGKYRVLLIMIVVLNRKAGCRNNPTAADGHLLGIV